MLGINGIHKITKGFFCGKEPNALASFVLQNCPTFLQFIFPKSMRLFSQEGRKCREGITGSQDGQLSWGGCSLHALPQSG